MFPHSPHITYHAFVNAPVWMEEDSGIHAKCIQLSRPQTVKKIWEYIKARDLQDPTDKRQIRCDEKMQLVFKQDKVHMFTMNKILGKQLYDVEDE